MLTVSNWLTDPNYYDTKPTPVHHWLNANDLVAANRESEVFLADGRTFNLFPIMVRRSDFVRDASSDRILARFPFLQLTAEEIALFESQELLVAENLRNYFYKSDNRKILDWRALLRKYLERGAVPLPFLSSLPEKPVFTLENRLFESARGERFTLPTTLTPELAYLCGVVNGDGNLTKYVLNIVDYSLENIRSLKKQFETLFQQTGRIQLQSENAPRLIITNLWVVRLFSFLTGQPIGGRKYDTLCEPLLFSQDPSLRATYWSGVMDADGSYAKRNITFTSTSKDYAKAFMSFLLSLTVKAKLNTRDDGTFLVYVPRRYHDIYKQHMYCFHPEKRVDFVNLKKGNTRQGATPQYFHSFDNNKLINGYFDFNYLMGLQVIGLGVYLQSLRGAITQQEFASKLNIHPNYLYQLENNLTAISIPLLNQFLTFDKDNSLLHLLLRFGRKLRYRRNKAPPIFLDFKPSPKLVLLAKNLIFYPSFIRLNSDDDKLLIGFQQQFGIKLQNKTTTNGTLRYFFTTFATMKK